jgi:hypothetical protein
VVPCEAGLERFLPMRKSLFVSEYFRDKLNCPQLLSDGIPYHAEMVEEKTGVFGFINGTL